MLDRVSVVGDDILIWPGRPSLTRADFDVRHRQMFGDHTTESLGSLSVGVVGVSGSGSPPVEMLVRLGVRRVVLIEPDHVEAKNPNPKSEEHPGGRSVSVRVNTGGPQ